ncbi:MAG: tetratricopeptide repeat protein [Acidobacteria bacterium]|jgi:tetratricopeptide (TPR) repeat protein|nr:tetratricopeptide repeat protein [Acidobacteriota bacterium]
MKRWLGFIGALALVLASGVEARAQMGAVRGKVLDQKGAPVPDAKVRFDSLGGMTRHYETRTNDKGEYTQVVVSGPYRITVSKDGYQGFAMEQRVGMGATSDLPTIQIIHSQSAAEEAMAPVVEEFERAGELSRAGKLDEAIAVYLELEKEQPDIPELYHNLGMLYGRQEKWPEAEAALQKSLELDPDNKESQVMLAQVHKSMGRGDEALAELEKLIQQSPGDPQLHYDVGVFYLNAQRYEDAYAEFDEVRKLDPDNVDVLYLLGTLSVNLGEIDRARGLLQEYLDRAPEDAQYRATASELVTQLQPEEPAER